MSGFNELLKDVKEPTVSSPTCTALLAGIEVVKDKHFNNYNFKFPNGASLPASMTELLLWELLKEIKKSNSC